MKVRKPHETHKGYFRKGTADNDGEYSFLFMPECKNMMYIRNRKERFMTNKVLCPKCGKVIVVNDND